MRLTRRNLLIVACTTSAGLAGCSGVDENPSPEGYGAPSGDGEELENNPSDNPDPEDDGSPMGDDQSEDADSNSENDRNDPKKRMEGGLESSVHTPSTGDDSRDDQYGDGYGTMTYGDMN